MAQKFTQNSPEYLTDEKLLASDFKSYADRLRFVRDFGKTQHLQILQKLTADQAFEVEKAVYAISEDGKDGFLLHMGATGPYPFSHVGRFTVNGEGMMQHFWGRRCLLPGEIDRLLVEPASTHARMKAMPLLHVMKLPEDAARQRSMLGVVDKFIQELNIHRTHPSERYESIASLTTDDFQAWEGSGVWAWPSGATEPQTRDSFAREVSLLQDSFGAPSGVCTNPGRTHTVTRAKAASSTLNLAFAHFDILGSGGACGCPCALEMMMAFALNDEGTKIKQALQFRSPGTMQEYASAFKMFGDVADKQEFGWEAN